MTQDEARVLAGLDDDDGTYVAPKVFTLGDLPERVRSRSVDEAFYQINVNYVEFGKIVDLMGVAVESMEKRVEELEAIRAKPPKPLTTRDIESAINTARSDLNAARTMFRRWETARKAQ